MKTKLETKFEKLSQPFIANLLKVESEYSEFLKGFIKKEIIGNDYFEEYLNEEVLYSCDFSDYTHDELIGEFVRKHYFLESVIWKQIFKLELKKITPFEEGGPFKVALANEQNH